MNTLQLKFNLIDKLIAISDTGLLQEIDKLLEKIEKIKVKSSETFKLTIKQMEMLKESEGDIAGGRIISDERLNEEEDKWLNE